MTDEDAFLTAIDLSPSDFTTYLVYADWLEENARPPEPCPDCRGAGAVEYLEQGEYGKELLERPCDRCKKSGVLTDGRRERAAGWRAMGELRVRPHTASWFSTVRRAVGLTSDPYSDLPPAWFALVLGDRDPGPTKEDPRVKFVTTRAAREAAAAAWVLLPDAAKEDAARRVRDHQRGTKARPEDDDP